MRRIALIVVGAAVVFAIGIALGEALHDNPKPGGHADARPDAAAAAARSGRTGNRDGHGSKPVNRFRKRKLWLLFAGDLLR